MINLTTPIRTANELQWNIQSLPHTGEHVQVAYTLSLDGQAVEQDIKTQDGVELVFVNDVDLTTRTQTPIRTANELQWNIQSLPHTGEHVQVAYSLTLNGQMVEEGIKTMNNVIDNGL